MKKFFLLVLFLAAMPASAFSAVRASDLEAFNKANQLYRDGKFSEAAAAYEALAGKYPGEAVFHYNLGNCLFRTNKLGESLVSWERAKSLEPRDGDVRANLNYARAQVQYRVEDKRSWYLKTAQDILDLFTEREVVSLVLLTYFFLAFSWVFVLFFKSGTTWGWKRRMLLLASAILFLVGMAKNFQTHFLRGAIVVAPEAQARSGPSASDQAAFKVGEGVKVYVLDKREDWSKIFLVNGDTGWIQDAKIKEIKI